MCAVPLEGTWRKCRKIEFLGFQIEFLDFWNEFLVCFDQNFMVFIEFLKKIPIFETFYLKIMEFLVRNRVLKDFEIEFLLKIEFFDFWPNRVFFSNCTKKA